MKIINPQIQIAQQTPNPINIKDRIKIKITINHKYHSINKLLKTSGNKETLKEAIGKKKKDSKDDQDMDNRLFIGNNTSKKSKEQQA